MSENTYGSNRERIDTEERRKLEEAGAVFFDSRRSRPLWFDGRFLKAQDLKQEQNYFLTRQSDMAVATGTGVKEGLRVIQGKSTTSLKIQRGFGTTFDGEQVVIQNGLTVDLADIPTIQQLNVLLGLSEEPAPSFRARTGLFIIALRPLEYTANPVAAYPTHIDDSRSVENGEIIEATAVTLVPFSHGGGFFDKNLRRSAAANRIFVTDDKLDIPSTSLPLAMIELVQGNIRWIDNYLVRREMASDRKDILGFGQLSIQLREAHYKQYENHLNDIIEQKTSLNTEQRISAGEYFVSLPPAGRLPSDSVDMKNETQHFFPAVMDVDISIVPEDELAALIEESMQLPPIELTASEDTLASTSVLILAPVKRHEFAGLIQSLNRKQIALRAPVSLTRSRLKPIDMIHKLRRKLPVYEIPPKVEEIELADADWHSIVARQKFLWFVRRRNINFKEEIIGTSVQMSKASEFVEETDMRNHLRTLNLTNNFGRLKMRGSTAAELTMVNMLSAPKFKESNTLLLGAMRELEKSKKLDERSAVEVSTRFSDTKAGEGVKKLEKVVMETSTNEDGTVNEASLERNRDKAEKLAGTHLVPELDALVRKLPQEEYTVFSRELRTNLESADTTSEDIARLITDKRRSIEK